MLDIVSYFEEVKARFKQNAEVRGLAWLCIKFEHYAVRGEGPPTLDTNAIRSWSCLLSRVAIASVALYSAMLYQPIALKPAM